MRARSGGAFPSVNAELARRVHPSAARTTQSPMRSVTSAGQLLAATAVSSGTSAAGRPRCLAGVSGTTLPATSADSASRTARPSRRVTWRTPSAQPVSTPTVSVNRPAGSPGSVSVRSETRLPTSAGLTRMVRRPFMENSTGFPAPSCSSYSLNRRY